MSSNLNLGYDEAVVLKQDRIKHGGIMAGNTDTLVLTNNRILYIKKSIFGKEKGTESFELSNIKIYEGRAQAVIANSDNNAGPTLEIYFNSSVENFGFESKRDIVNWIKKINELTTGRTLENEEIDNSNFFVPIMQSVANTIKTTLGIYRDTFGEKAKKEQVSCKCEGCGATCAGIKGETSRCPYCGNFISFN